MHFEIRGAVGTMVTAQLSSASYSAFGCVAAPSRMNSGGRLPEASSSDEGDAAASAIPPPARSPAVGTEWWSQHILKYFGSALKARPQVRPISMMSACTGLWSEGWCAQALGSHRGESRANVEPPRCAITVFVHRGGCVDSGFGLACAQA